MAEKTRRSGSTLVAIWKPLAIGLALVVVGNVLLNLFVLRRTVRFSQTREAILTERRESVQAISDSVRSEVSDAQGENKPAKRDYYLDEALAITLDYVRFWN